MSNNIIRHGEVLLYPTVLPKEAMKVRETVKEIVAHSETGHHHVLTAEKPFTVYSWNEDTYIEVPELSTLLHEKTGKEMHTPHKIVPGVYKIIIKKQFDYFSGKLSRVRD